MQHEETLDKIMVNLWDNPYCRGALKEKALQNAVDTSELDPSLIMHIYYQNKAGNEDYSRFLRDAHKEMLKICGSKSEMAGRLGISRTTLSKHLDSYGLNEPTEQEANQERAEQ